MAVVAASKAAPRETMLRLYATRLGVLNTLVESGETYGNRFLLIHHHAPLTTCDATQAFWIRFARWACHSGPRVDDTLHIYHGSNGRTAFWVVGGDGQIATHCGNGLLYAASRLFAHEKTGMGEFICGNRRHVVQRSRQNLWLNLGAPRPISAPSLPFPGLTRAPIQVDTGEPHAVSFMDHLESPHREFEVLGRAVCDHVGAAGINWNLVTADSSGLRIRTFERGVRRPTASCGTGAAASFWAAHCAGLILGDETSVTAPGGTHQVCVSRGDVLLSGLPIHHDTWTMSEFLEDILPS